MSFDSTFTLAQGPDDEILYRFLLEFQAFRAYLEFSQSIRSWQTKNKLLSPQLERRMPKINMSMCTATNPVCACTERVPHRGDY